MKTDDNCYCLLLQWQEVIGQYMYKRNIVNQRRSTCHFLIDKVRRNTTWRQRGGLSRKAFAQWVNSSFFLNSSFSLVFTGFKFVSCYVLIFEPLCSDWQNGVIIFYLTQCEQSKIKTVQHRTYLMLHKQHIEFMKLSPLLLRLLLLIASWCWRMSSLKNCLCNGV